MNNITPVSFYLQPTEKRGRKGHDDILFMNLNLSCWQIHRQCQTKRPQQNERAEQLLHTDSNKVYLYLTVIQFFSLSSFKQYNLNWCLFLFCVVFVRFIFSSLLHPKTSWVYLLHLPRSLVFIFNGDRVSFRSFLLYYDESVLLSSCWYVTWYHEKWVVLGKKLKCNISASGSSRAVSADMHKTGCCSPKTLHMRQEQRKEKNSN